MKHAPATPSAALAHFASETRFEDLPASTVEKCKRCLLDALGVMLAASTLGEGCRAFVELALEQGGTAESTLLGFRRKVPALMAALANGAMAHALDFEDTHDGALLHPNAATVPAALAIAEATPHVSGKELITALVVGCELVCRLGLALRVSLDDYGFFPPPMLSAFGATAAAGRLYRLDERQMRDAFSLSLCQATCSAELKHNPHSIMRAVRDGFAAKAGVLSAQLARKGIRGFDLPFEGQAGFFALYARGQYDPAVLTEQLGQRFAVETVSFKPWPTCRGTHAFIQAALTLAERYAPELSRIHCIRARGQPIGRMLSEPVESKQRPATAIDAKFSIPFTVATALCHRSVGLEHFYPEALEDARVRALARRVSFEALSGSPALGHAVSGVLEIEMTDGRVFTEAIAVPYGHPDQPLDDAALIAKFEDCAQHAMLEMTADAVSQIVDRVLALERIEDVRSELCVLL
jgi:2-methylcitrate dehydratase PrpD